MGISALAVVAALLFWFTQESENLPSPVTIKAPANEPPMDRLVVSVREFEPVEQVPQPPPVAVAEPLPVPAPPPTTPATQIEMPPIQTSNMVPSKSGAPPPIPVEVPPIQMQKPASSQAGGENPLAEEGVVLPIYADYRSAMGFPVYAEAMRRVGGIFLIFDGEKIRGEADVLNRKVLPIAPARLAGLSPRSREITEPALLPCLEEAKRLLGPGFYSIILLLPTRVDQHVQAEVVKELRLRGLDPSSVVQVRGRYVSNEGRLVLTLTDSVSRSGRATPLQSVISF